MLIALEMTATYFAALITLASRTLEAARRLDARFRASNAPKVFTLPVVLSPIVTADTAPKPVGNVWGTQSATTIGNVYATQSPLTLAGWTVPNVIEVEAAPVATPAKKPARLKATAAKATKTATAKKTATVKPRSVGFDGGIMTIVEGKVSDEYAVEAIPSDLAGRAFTVRKLNIESQPYAVIIGEPSECSCECLGFIRWNKCRHVSALLALETASRI